MEQDIDVVFVLPKKQTASISPEQIFLTRLSC